MTILKYNKGASIFLLFLFPFTAALGCQKSEQVEKKADKQISKDAVKSVRSMEDYRESIDNFKKLLLKEPNNVILLISLGNAYFDIGMNEEAIRFYKRALEIHPDNVPVRTDLGTAYRRVGEPDKALEAYRKSLAVDPRHSITRYNMGVVLLWDKKDVDSAIKIWEEVLRIDPYFILANEIKNNINTLKNVKSTSGES